MSGAWCVARPPWAGPAVDTRHIHSHPASLGWSFYTGRISHITGSASQSKHQDSLIPSLSGSLQANGLGALGLTLTHKACIQREQAPWRASVSHCPDGSGGLPRVCSSWGRGVSGGGCGGDSCLIRLVPQHGLGFPDGWVGKEFTCSACRRHRRRGLGPWIGKISWRGIQQSTPVILTWKKIHGQRSLSDDGPQGHKESDTTEQLSMQKHAA